MDSVLSKLSTMPRTLVVFTEPFMPGKLHNMVNPSWTCSLALTFGCPCITRENLAEKTQLRDDYSAELRSLAAQYRSSDFGVEVVPALAGMYPNATAGGPDPSFLAPDCFHFNAELHSMVIISTSCELPFLGNFLNKTHIVLCLILIPCRQVRTCGTTWWNQWTRAPPPMMSTSCPSSALSRGGSSPPPNEEKIAGSISKLSI